MGGRRTSQKAHSPASGSSVQSQQWDRIARIVSPKYHSAGLLSDFHLLQALSLCSFRACRCYPVLIISTCVYQSGPDQGKQNYDELRDKKCII